MNLDIVHKRSFQLTFVFTFLVCFFGVTIGWDTILVDIIVLIVGTSTGLAIGTVIRRAREGRRR